MCFWGGQKCFGYNNKQEDQPFCSYGGFYDSFCDRNWKNWKTRMGRLFACKKLGGKHQKCSYLPEKIQEEVINKCDSSSMWSKWSKEPLTENHSNTLYYARYDTYNIHT